MTPRRPVARSLRTLALLGVSIGTASAPVTFADTGAGTKTANWPQWRGPEQTGSVETSEPPATWAEGQNVKWKVKLPGRGSSTPIIWGDQIFIQTAIPTGQKGAPPAAPAAPAASADAPPATEPPAQPPAPGPGGPPGGRRGGRGRGGPGGGMRAAPPTETHQFTLLCLDRRTGKTLWQQAARSEVPHEGHHKDHGFASHSPVTDGKLVFAYFGSRGLHCYDMQGNLKWSKDFGRMQTRMSFGEGSSPALADGVVVVNWDHEGADFIAGLDAETGKELWRQPRDEDTTWATPLVVRHDGKAQVIVPATKKIRSYDLKTGAPIWECGGLTANVIPTPVAGGDGVVYITSGFRGAALLAIKLGRSGDLTNTDAVLWRAAKSTPYVPSPVLYKDRLYFFSGNQAILSSYDVKTGKPVIDAERVDELQGVYASPVAAGGRVYLVGRNGVTVVVKHADKLEVVATNRLDEGFDASPAIVGNELYLRGQEHLYCIAVPAAK